LFISGRAVKTLPRRMWEGLLFEIDPTIASVSTLLIVMSALLLCLGQLVSYFGTRSNLLSMYVEADRKQEVKP
jgi:ABC-type spermidine/putrescine transport system permease subunit II